jgi:SAM-dependent MidA family methyltransferase
VSKKGGSHSLAERLKRRIQREGAISFRDWMNAALYDPHAGYYCRPDRVRWGRNGDYRTAPERSPLFAATFAAYFARLSDQLGSPHPFTILEYGGGNGTFARGVLSALKQQREDVYAATRYLCVEMNAEQLEPFAAHFEVLNANQQLSQIEAGVIFSNELIDAFPVHRVCYRDGRLRELFVGLDAENQFTWMEQEPSTPQLKAYFAHHRIKLMEGQTAEVNLETEAWLKRMAALVRRGFLMTVDYGASAAELYQTPERFDGTLRSFARHGLSTGVLSDPGERDITATINWTELIETGKQYGWETIELQRQHEFLLRGGLLRQLERLSVEAASEAERVNLRIGARDLILPEFMGADFQVLVQQKVQA